MKETTYTKLSFKKRKLVQLKMLFMIRIRAQNCERAPSKKDNTDMLKMRGVCMGRISGKFMINENHDIAIAMSPSRAHPVLPWLGVFKCLYQSHCTDWGHLNV